MSTGRLAISAAAADGPTAPGRQQKWLEQLCQVESRLLANWQEFAEHRQEVQLQLQEMHASLRRLTTSEPQWARQRSDKVESEVERCNRRLQQFGEAQGDTASRVGELRGSIDGTREELESLRVRIAERLQGMAAAIEEHQREVSETSEGILREALGSAKRAGRAAAEEMMRKMEDLGCKLGERIAGIEDSSAKGLQRVHLDVKDVLARAEAEVRERTAEAQAKLREVSDQAVVEAARVSKLDVRLQELYSQAEGWQELMRQSAQHADCTNVRLDELRASAAEQIDHLRSEVSAAVHEQHCAQRDAFRASLAEQIAHLREDVSTMVQNQHRAQRDAFDSYVTEANERANQTKVELTQSCELRANDSRLHADALRAELNEFQGRLQGELSALAEQLGQLRRVQGEQAEDAIGGAAEWRQRLDSVDQAVHQLREANESREQRLRAFGLNVTEQVSQARDEVMRLCRERAGEVGRSAQQALESSQDALHNKLEALQASFGEQVAAAEEQNRRLYDELRQQSRAWATDALTQARGPCEALGAQLRERLDAAVAELRKSQDAHRGEAAVRHEALERQQTEHAVQLRERLRDLQERYESLKATAEERSTRLELVSRACADVAEARGELACELEAAQRSAQKSLDYSTAQLEAKIDASVKAVASQCSQDLKEGLARLQDADEARGIDLRQLMHEGLTGVQSGAQEREARLMARIAAASHDLEEKLRQQREGLSDQLAETRRNSEEQLRRQLSHLTEQLGQQANAHCNQLEETKNVFFEHLTVQTAGARDKAVERATEGQRASEERVLKMMQALGQEMNDRLKSHQEQAADSQRTLGESLRDVRDASNEQLASMKAKTDDRHREFEASLKLLEQGVAEAESLISRTVADTRRDLEEHVRQQRDGLVEQLGEVRHGHEEHLRRQHASLAEQLKEQTSAHSGHLEETRKGLVEHIKTQLASTEEHALERAAEGQRLSEERVLKMMRALGQEMNERMQRHQEQATEAQRTLGDSLRSTRDVANEQLAHLKAAVDGQHTKHDAGIHALEQTFADAARHTERQTQELRQQLQARCTETDSRIEALRRECEQEQSSTATRINALDQRQVADRERFESASETQWTHVTKLVDKRTEGAVEHITATVSEHEVLMKRKVDEIHTFAADAVAQLRTSLRNVESETKARHDETMAKCVALQVNVAELKVSATAAATEAHKREEHVNAEFERRAQAARDHTDKVEARVAEESAGAARALDDLEQRLTAQVKNVAAEAASGVARVVVANTDTQRALDAAEHRLGTQLKSSVAEANAGAARALEAAEHRLSAQLKATGASFATQMQEAKVEAERIVASVEECRRAADTRAGELAMRLDRTDEGLKQQAQAFTEEGDRRSKRHAEALEALRKRCADQQQGLEASLQRNVEAVAQAKAAALEGQQRFARDAADTTMEVRQRVDETAERLGSEVRDVQAALLSRLEDLQCEHRAQLAADRQATQALVEGLGKQRERDELQAQRHLDEVHRELKRDISEAFQRAEDGRRALGVAAQDQADGFERRLREQAEASSKASGEIADELRTKTVELKGRLVGCEREVRQLADEHVPALARRWDGVHVAQASALEELKKAQQEGNQELQRRIREEANVAAASAQQLSAAVEESKERDKALEKMMHTDVSDAQTETQNSIGAVRTELASLQWELQALRGEHLKSYCSLKDKHTASMGELAKKQEDWIAVAQRRFDDLEGLTSQARILAMCTEHVDGVVRAVTGQELQAFQRDALDSVEWKLERCVQWLHGANVKLGLNPHGTLFSTDRFREMLFDNSTSRPDDAAGPAPNVAGAARRPSSARRKSGRA